MQWIYLSKKGQDEYIDRLARGAGEIPTTLENWRYEDQPKKGLVLRGIMKHKIIKQCWQDQRPFRYMDTGYVGNRPSSRNPQGWKVWHRIVENDLQHDEIFSRPADRWDSLGIPIFPHNKKGRTILIAAPDEKPCAFYGINQAEWIAETMDIVKKHTDRPVKLRLRDASPDVRVRDPETSFAAALADDVFAVVTFNSVAATESVLSGIPVFVTAPCNAARPVANLDLSKIDSPWFPDPDQVRRWAYHLAYGQFHNRELEDGSAVRILDETREMMRTK